MRLALIHHVGAGSYSMAAVAAAVEAGARDDAITGVEVSVYDPLTITVGELLAADGYLLGTAAHFGAMSGALKHMFDQNFYAIGGALPGQPRLGAPVTTTATTTSTASTRGRPTGLWVHGRYDVTGTVAGVTALTAALGWRPVSAPLELLGDVDAAGLESAYELGATISAHLSSMN